MLLLNHHVQIEMVNIMWSTGLTSTTYLNNFKTSKSTPTYSIYKCKLHEQFAINWSEDNPFLATNYSFWSFMLIHSLHELRLPDTFCEIIANFHIRYQNNSSSLYWNLMDKIRKDINAVQCRKMLQTKALLYWRKGCHIERVWLHCCI